MWPFSFADAEGRDGRATAAYAYCAAGGPAIGSWGLILSADEMIGS
jgi:hypothetical protein